MYPKALIAYHCVLYRFEPYTGHTCETSSLQLASVPGGFSLGPPFSPDRLNGPLFMSWKYVELNLETNECQSRLMTIGSVPGEVQNLIKLKCFGMV